MIEYSSHYRNRPIESSKDYNARIYNNKTSSRKRALKLTGLAALVALHFLAYKTCERKTEDRIQYEVEQRMYENE